MLSNAVADMVALPLPAENNNPTRSGVKNIPKMFEAEAETIAAGILPPAMDVKAIDDWTVEGKTHK